MERGIQKRRSRNKDFGTVSGTGGLTLSADNYANNIMFTSTTDNVSNSYSLTDATNLNLQ